MSEASKNPDVTFDDVYGIILQPEWKWLRRHGSGRKGATGLLITYTQHMNDKQIDVLVDCLNLVYENYGLPQVNFGSVSLISRHDALQNLSNYNRIKNIVRNRTGRMHRPGTQTNQQQLSGTKGKTLIIDEIADVDMEVLEGLSGKLAKWEALI